jgi:K(+)-stimulated pyrophosphate-energized sodium pump
MSGLPKELRKATDALDAVGNTTKAVTKGYAIGSAGLGALVLFAAYNQDLRSLFRMPQGIPTRASGRFPAEQSVCGCRSPVRRPLALLVRSAGDDGVGRAASAIVEEVRRQFREKPGIRRGPTSPTMARPLIFSPPRPSNR